MTKPPSTAPDSLQDKYMVPALERGLKLLLQFSRAERRLSAPELARRLGLPRTTTFRLLNTLETMGFVRRDEASNLYQLDMAVLRLGFEYLASLELTELGRPLLERLRDETGFSANLAIRDGRAIVFVAKASAPTPFVSTVYVGTRLPAHATLLGRVLLSDLTLEQLRALYPEDTLQSFSPRTPRTVNEMHAIAQADHERGYAIDKGFFESDVGSAAAPVRDHTGQMVAAIGVTIPMIEFEATPQAEEAVVAKVRRAADELSRLLDYAPHTVHHSA
ncbi:IclR family transcriptional regulator [Verticiella sediminum]|uniref:IclR family transcriptional regulator n=1 Tax=Verticiella sediminum TaxID=1247510 RepID=A0A556AB30_9BURK|nr:IclR family transcriptional regulator [Verticiella sediminum]TSH90092.1 IclR family transcriptional regulator [Verticiella sediminum]